MSKSRLEKFLYALYSLDSSDLPNPLSRIEELYKCLVTGDEAPTFEPLSRVEKYLMAILGVYDVVSLPNPLSRVEVLLYKLATGDDNLDDVKSFLSEHEELLAEIIRNGGVGGSINIEYVLHALSTGYNTLYNTAEKPVKSAILKGNTLVNLHKLEKYSVYGVVLDGGINQHFGSDTLYATWRMYDISMLKPDTEYGVFCWVLENTLSEKPWYGHYYHSSDTVFNASTELNFSAGETGLKFAKLTTISDFTGKTCGIRHLLNANTPSSEYVKFRCVIVEYQEGMENWDIPYFEGMQSVKMPVLTTTGKNLISKWYDGKMINDNGELIIREDQIGTDFILIETEGNFVCESLKNGTVRLFNINKQLIGKLSNVNKTFNVPNQVKYITFNYFKEAIPSFLQLEKGTMATSYEPYKSNILTVNEEIELCEVNGTHDELNLLTGELTQRVHEFVLDGSEKWNIVSSEDRVNTSLYRADKIIANDLPKVTWGVDHGVSLPIPYRWNTYDNDEEGVVFTQPSGHCYVRSTIRNLSDFTQWLMANPITIQYELITESIKTVDLSVVDQDGNSTELSTFNDITHVTLSSEGLIPKAELEVATKNEEVLNTMSLEMDDISKTQNDLQETLDTQSENVDSTMIATTEIYEGLL